MTRIRTIPRVAIAGLGALASLVMTFPAHATSQAMFKPASPWSTQQQGATCVASNVFDNGFTLSVARGQGTTSTLTLDIKQEAFDPGRTYGVLVTLDQLAQRSVIGTALSTTTLSLRLPSADLSQAANTMNMVIDGNGLSFSVAGLGDTSCFKPTAVPTLPEVAASPAAQDRLSKRVSRATETPQKQNLEPAAQPQQKSVVSDISEPVFVPDTSAPAPVMTWTAHKGEDLKTVVLQWAEIAGYDLAWEATKNPTLKEDISFSGEFEQAVQTLLIENDTDFDLMPVADDPSQQSLYAMTQQAKPQGSDTTGHAPKWVAMPGQPLTDILDTWADKSQTKIIWKTHIDSPVKAPIRFEGDFETALKILLDQFSLDQRQPVAQLNIDPITGERILMIDAAPKA